ncbi:hypothetical protein WICPIJ_006108 [Wickerhamomyces pijperi]|uniref:Rab-GAP TBC domain-containing protein n=2 Tax=Saccharomycotina TaxID=147537 RepID=A0A9P8Q2E5_WICPI|nr:hypothetical protein WICPIJ_006108 [Wickerhamomyces pijperi]
MSSFFSNLRDRASSISQLFDNNDPSKNKHQVPKLTKDESFLQRYCKLPETEEIVERINVEILIMPEVEDLSHSHRTNIVYQGKLYITNGYLIFDDDLLPTSKPSSKHTYIAHLSSIRKVERTPLSSSASGNSASSSFAISLHTTNNLKLIVKFLSLRSRAEQFCHRLKGQLRDTIANVSRDQSTAYLSTLYSEFLIRKNSPDTPEDEKKKITVPPGGLGLIFKFPGDAVKSKDKSKLKLWYDYFLNNGRNLSLSQTPMFHKLIRVGIPNRLRGELWLYSSGGMFVQYSNPDQYKILLSVHDQQLELNPETKTQAIDEIEKDLNRSLPEYSAYQSQEGISRLRNVLTAYSLHDPETGYCQAMNIITAALLIFQSEEQAFYTLSQLVNKYVPGYYAPSMYGTLLDQRVFESLVAKTMPVLWEHIVKFDVQLSVVSLPWFLSLFLNSMPLVYAFRVMDLFFVYGVRVLFQIGLAVLRINGEELLECVDVDDGLFISLLKRYFATLDEPVNPMAHDPKARSLTKFQQLLVVAFREFINVDDAMISKERDKYRHEVMTNVESFIKKSQLRNLPRVRNLNQEQVGKIYDLFYETIAEDKTDVKSSGVSAGTTGTMDFATFKNLLSKIFTWCSYDSIGQDEQFLEAIFQSWDTTNSKNLTLSDLVTGLDTLYTTNLMDGITTFFQLFDHNNTGEVDKETILQISEALLYLTKQYQDGILLDQITQSKIEKAVAGEVWKSLQKDESNINLPDKFEIDQEQFQQEQRERYLTSASDFISRCFEYATQSTTTTESSATDNIIDIDDKNISSNRALDPKNNLSLNLATFRMVILADETLELFFDHGFRSMIKFDDITISDSRRPSTFFNSGNSNRGVKDMFEGWLADAGRVADQVRRLRMESQSHPEGPPDHTAQPHVGDVEDDDDDDDILVNESGTGVEAESVLNLMSDNEHGSLMDQMDLLTVKDPNTTSSSVTSTSESPSNVSAGNGISHQDRDLIDFD